MFKKKTIDPLGNQTIEISDAFHRIDTVEKRSSKNELLAKTVLRYDRKGNKTKETEFVYADGMLLREYVVEWTYSPTDLVETCTEEPGTPEEKKTSNSYIRGGLLETITKPDGVCVTHGYDGFLRLSSISSSDGTISYTYSYDLNDNVLSVKDEKLQLTHTKTYDTHSRVTKDSIGTGVETSFFYDALDRVTGFSTGNAKINYLYQSGRLHNVVRKDGSDTQLYTHTYDSFDLRGNVTKSSPIASCGSIQFNWDLLGRLDHTTSDQFEETLTKFDDAGNLLEQTLRDPQGMITSTFSYDDLYQLIDEKGVLDAAYKNDSLNNRLQKNDDPYTINALNQLVSDNDTSYEYDKNGNPIQIGSMRLSYDALDRLILLERPGFSRSEYAYDESHRRISKSTSLWQEGSWHEDETLRFIFFNKREVGCLAPDDTMKEFRVLGLGKGAELGASVAIEVDGGIFCPLHDHRGNISLLIDTATNQPTDTYRYSVFGEETSFGSTQNPWHFASKRTDPESGFVFFGRRYYSPTVGRFITPDPLGFADGPNLYSYVHNSPLILVDPYGLWAEFSAYPSITDPCGHDSSSSLPFSCQPSNYSNGPADSPGASGSGAGFCIEMNPILGGGYGIGRGFNNPLVLLEDDKDKYHGQPTGEKIGVVGFVVAAALVGMAAPEAGLLLAAYYTLRGFVSLCSVASFCVNGPSCRTVNESFVPKGGPSYKPVEQKDKEQISQAPSNRGVNNPTVREALQNGREAHDRLKQEVKENAPGWFSEKTIDGLNGKTYRPDVTKPDGTFLELKPNSPSGIAAGEKQVANYEKQTGMKGEAIYYDKATGDPLYDLRSMYKK